MENCSWLDWGYHV